MNELRELTLVRIRMFLREPEAVFWVFLFPIALALVLGLAFRNRGVEASRVAVLGDTLRAPWTAALEEHPQIDLIRFDDENTLESKLRSGSVALRLSEEAGAVVLRYDPTRPESEGASARVREALEQAAGRVDLLEIRNDPMTARGSRYIDFLIPGLLGMNLMSTGIWGSGFALVDMRQKKLLRLLQATPMRRSRFLFAQILSRLCFLVMEVGVLTAFGTLVMKVPFRGDFPSFATFALLGGFCFTGIGLLLASRSQTVEGVSGLMNFVMMPMWLLSGIFFSYEKFPEFFHPAIRALPLTSLNDALRANMLEGAGLQSLWGSALIVAAWGVVCFFLALRIFRWR